MYNRPYPAWLALVVCLPLTAAVVVLATTQGLRSPAPWAVLLVNIIALGVFTVLAPDITITSRRVVPDGTVLRVRRPLVGFKRCERMVGVSGGYDVRVDGFRYEEAYVRL